MFNNLMDFWKSKQTSKKPDVAEDKNLEHYKTVLKNIVYDESLIDELTEANPQNYITQISVKFKKELE